MADDSNEVGTRLKFCKRDPEEIRKFYEEGWTDARIGAHFGVTDVAVSQFRRKHGIQTLSQLQRLQPGREHTFDQVGRDKLLELYATQSDRQIAQRFCVSKTAVRYRRGLFGIPSKSKTERCILTDDLTARQKEILIGTMLGDGHLLSRGVLQVSHSHAQLTYLKYLHKELGLLSKPIWYDDGVKKNEVFFAFGFRTHPHSWLRYLYSIFYPQGRRVFPKTLLENLTPRSLAIWYFDDGHLEDGLPSIALGDVSPDEARDVAGVVGARFGLNTFVREADPENCQVLRFRASSTDLFFYLVREFAPSDLLYKIPHRHWPEGVTSLTPSRVRGEVPFPSDLFDRSKGWSSLCASEREGLLKDVVAFWCEFGFPHPNPRPEEANVLANLDFEHVIKGDTIKIRQVGQTTCNAFAPHIWDGKSYGSMKSPAEIFSDPATLRGCTEFILNSGNVPTASRIRSALRFWKHSGIYNFRPSAAKVLVDRFCRPGGTVYDPCGGYGGRLFGSLMSKARPKYVACEPNTKSFEALRNLHGWLADFFGGVVSQCEVHCIPAEEFEPPSSDLIFTSPPYWKREIYCTEETQSGLRYRSYETWLNCFWKEVLRRGINALTEGGWLVFNVDDFSIGGSNYALVQDTVDLVRGFGFGEPDHRLRYQLPGDKQEWVLCWHKGGRQVVSEVPSSEPVLTTVSCRVCHAMKPLSQLRGGVCLSCLASITPRGTSKTCQGCGESFVTDIKSQLFCTKACYARYRRREHRKFNPAKLVREFTCQECGVKWETESKGRFKFCPSCKSKKGLERRTKVCQYRHCEETFEDMSPKNSQKFCCPEHARREKAFRLGKAQDESYFRANKEVGWRTCQQCGGKFKRDQGKSIRCPSCLDANRNKCCRQCGASFRDMSLNNTRRFCNVCQ